MVKTLSKLSKRGMSRESSLFGGRYNTDEQEVGVEGKSQPEGTPVVVRCKISTSAVRN